MAEDAKISKFSMMQKNIVRFFREIKAELKKVIWPNREQLINNTVTVLMACLIIGAIIWIIDAGLLKLSEMIFIKG